MVEHTREPLEEFTPTFRSFAEKQFLSTGETYARKQGRAGAESVERLGAWHRDKSQLAARLEYKLRPYFSYLRKHADAFIDHVEGVKVSSDPKIVEAAGVWKDITKGLADLAQKYEMELIAFDKAKQDFVKIPFQPRQNFFPHEWDFDAIRNKAYREKFIKSFA